MKCQSLPALEFSSDLSRLEVKRLSCDFVFILCSNLESSK
jgi:hypothetical protein